MVGFWLVGYWAPWLPQTRATAWFDLAAWGARHGLRDLQTSSRCVTAIITCSALLGAILRLKRGRPRSRIFRQQLGLFATGVPLAIFLPSGGAILFILALLAVVCYLGWHTLPVVRAASSERVWNRFLRESFPSLSASCFVTLSWQYNAHLLLRAILVALGTAMILRAAFPGQSLPGSTPGH